jgi:hypothetical protein
MPVFHDGAQDDLQLTARKLTFSRGQRVGLLRCDRLRGVPRREVVAVHTAAGNARQGQG